MGGEYVTQKHSTIYEVFTRLKRGDQLAHIGTVEASNEKLAKMYASYIYDEEKWAEIFIINRNHLITVRELEPLFKKEGGELHV
jgi:1,2-phenylacetyl-CoA epoxidase PaaB subunit